MDKIIDENLVIEKYNELRNVRNVAKFFKKRITTISNILNKNKIIKKNNTEKKIIYKSNLITNEKVCSKCKINKSIEEFPKTKTNKIGYSSLCKECKKIYNKQKYNNRIIRLKSTPEGLDKLRKKRRRRYKKRHENPVYKFASSISDLIRKAITLKGYTKKSKLYKILGVDWEYFKKYIENRFDSGMGWHNRELWHIDHIFPIANAKTEEEVIKLNHYTNIQPLWVKDNILKGKKITFPGVIKKHFPYHEMFIDGKTITIID